MPLSARHGKNTVVGFANLNLTEYLNEISVSHEVETGETTTFSDEAKTFITGLADATITASGLFGVDQYSAPVTTYLENAQSYQTSWAQLTWADSGKAGARARLAQVQLTGLEISSPVSDVVSLSLEWQARRAEFDFPNANHFSGVHGGFLLGYGSVATTTEFAAIDNGAATDGGLILNGLILSAGAGTTTRVQHSADGVTWADIYTRTYSSAGAGWYGSLYFSGTIQRYVRLAVEVTASVGHMMYAVARM